MKKEMINDMQVGAKSVDHINRHLAVFNGLDVPRYIIPEFEESGELGIKDWGDVWNSPQYNTTVSGSLTAGTYYSIIVVPVNTKINVGGTPLYGNATRASIPKTGSTGYTFDIPTEHDQYKVHSAGSATALNASGATDAGMAWVVDQWVDYYLKNVETGDMAVITANTATGITAAVSVASGARYQVVSKFCNKRLIYSASGASAAECNAGPFYLNGIVEDMTTATYNLTVHTTAADTWTSNHYQPPAALCCREINGILFAGGGIEESRGKAEIDTTTDSTSVYVLEDSGTVGAKNGEVSLFQDSSKTWTDDEHVGLTLLNDDNDEEAIVGNSTDGKIYPGTIDGNAVEIDDNYYILDPAGTPEDTGTRSAQVTYIKDSSKTWTDNEQTGLTLLNDSNDESVIVGNSTDGTLYPGVANGVAFGVDDNYHILDPAGTPEETGTVLSAPTASTILETAVSTSKALDEVISSATANTISFCDPTEDASYTFTALQIYEKQVVIGDITQIPFFTGDVVAVTDIGISLEIEFDSSVPAISDWSYFAWNSAGNKVLFIGSTSSGKLIINEVTSDTPVIGETYSIYLFDFTPSGTMVGSFLFKSDNTPAGKILTQAPRNPAYNSGSVLILEQEPGLSAGDSIQVIASNAGWTTDQFKNLSVDIDSSTVGRVESNNSDTITLTAHGGASGDSIEVFYGPFTSDALVGSFLLDTSNNILGRITANTTVLISINAAHGLSATDGFEIHTPITGTVTTATTSVLDTELLDTSLSMTSDEYVGAFVLDVSNNILARVLSNSEKLLTLNANHGLSATDGFEIHVADETGTVTFPTGFLATGEAYTPDEYNTLLIRLSTLGDKTIADNTADLIALTDSSIPASGETFDILSALFSITNPYSYPDTDGSTLKVARYTILSGTIPANIFKGDYVSVTGSGEAGNNITDLEVIRVADDLTWFEVQNNDVVVAEFDIDATTTFTRNHITGNTSGADQTYFTKGMVGARFDFESDDVLEPWIITWVDEINQQLGIDALYEGNHANSDESFEILSDYSLYYSDLLNPHRFRAENLSEISDHIRAIRGVGDWVLIFCENSLWRLPYAELGRVPELVSEHIRCVSDQSVVDIPSGVAFYDGNGFSATDGGSVNSLTAYRARDYVDSINRSLEDQIVGVYNARLSRVEFYFPIGDETENNYGLAIALDSGNCYPIKVCNRQAAWIEIENGIERVFSASGDGSGASLIMEEEEMNGTGTVLSIVALSAVLSGCVSMNAMTSTSSDAVPAGLQGSISWYDTGTELNGESVYYDRSNTYALLTDGGARIIKTIEDISEGATGDYFEEDSPNLFDANGSWSGTITVTAIADIFSGTAFQAVAYNSTDEAMTDVLCSVLSPHAVQIISETIPTDATSLITDAASFSYGIKWIDFSSPQYRHQLREIHVELENFTGRLVMEHYKEQRVGGTASPVQVDAVDVTTADSKIVFKFRQGKTYKYGFKLRGYATTDFKIHSIEPVFDTQV